MIFPENTSITIPLLIYHPLQIILGNSLTPSFQRWLKDAKYEWFVLWRERKQGLFAWNLSFLGITELAEEFNKHFH